MKLSRRSLLGALAALPLWGLAAKGLVEEAVHPLTKARRERLLHGEWVSEPYMAVFAAPTYAINKHTGWFRCFKGMEPINLDEWAVSGVVNARVEGLDFNPQTIVNGIGSFGAGVPL